MLIYAVRMVRTGVARQIGIALRTLQRPHPRIHGGFAAPMRTADFLARENGKVIVLADDLAFCEALTNRWLSSSERAGRTATRADSLAWGGLLMLTDSKAKADALMDEHEWFLKAWFIPNVLRLTNVLIGTADDCADKIRRARDRLGFDELFLMFGQGHLEPEQNEEEINNFIAKVAPRFSTRDEHGTWI